MSVETLNKEQLTIRIHHVGGIGGYGPAEVLNKLGDVEWVVYDAQADALAASHLLSKNTRLVRHAIGGPSLKRSKFYVTEWPSASSLYKPAKSAEDYTLVTLDRRLQVWGDHTRIREALDMDLSTLDKLAESKEVPTGDFLSIDAQGAELPILEGASEMLRDTVLGVVCEVEFSALYEGQPLFDDILRRLRTEGFRLCEIFHTQYFNTKPFPPEAQGKGFLTVGEALFLKEIGNWLDSPDGRIPSLDAIVRSLKLAALAVAFDQLDYALDICNRLVENWSISLDDLAARTHVGYIGMLRDLHYAAKAIQADRKVATELKETDPRWVGLPRSYVLVTVSIAVLKLLVRQVASRFTRKLTGRSIKVKSPPLARILYEYGFEDLAMKQALRGVDVPYLGSGAAASYLDMLITFATRFV